MKLLDKPIGELVKETKEAASTLDEQQLGEDLAYRYKRYHIMCLVSRAMRRDADEPLSNGAELWKSKYLAILRGDVSDI